MDWTALRGDWRSECDWRPRRRMATWSGYRAWGGRRCVRPLYKRQTAPVRNESAVVADELATITTHSTYLDFVQMIEHLINDGSGEHGAESVGKRFLNKHEGAEGVFDRYQRRHWTGSPRQNVCRSKLMQKDFGDGTKRWAGWSWEREARTWPAAALHGQSCAWLIEGRHTSRTATSVTLLTA